MAVKTNEELAQQMRLGMRRLASGVSIVTGRDADGNRLAMTASSVTSLSDTPPSLLVCIHKASYLSKAIQETGVFCISLLSEDHQEISMRCASPENELDRFAIGEWTYSKDSGLFFLNDAQAVFHCHKQAEMEYGTHYVFIGDIQSVQIGEEAVKPLIYLNGRYVKEGDSL